MGKIEHTILTHQEVYEYSFSPIPADKRKPTRILLLVLIGFSLSTSGIKVGMQAGNSMPFWEALCACIAGNLVLFFIALFWGILGQRSGSTNAALITKILGAPTSLLFSSFVILAMIGWMGMNGSWLATITKELFKGWSLPIPLTIILFIALGAFCSLYGWKSMEWLARLLVPAIILFAVYMVIHASSMANFGLLPQPQPRETISTSTIISTVIGNYAMSATTMADLCRFAKTRRSVLGCTAVYGATLALCNLCGIALAQATGALDLTYSIYMLGLTAPGLICLSMCTYTTQNVNTYFGSLALQNILKKTAVGGDISHKSVVLILGGLAMIVGSMGIGRYLSQFARFLTLGAVSLTGIILTEMLISKKLGKTKGFMPLIAFLFSIMVAVLFWIYKGINSRILIVALGSAVISYIVLRGWDGLMDKRRNTILK